MPRSPVLFTHTIGAAPAPLKASRLIADVDVVAPSGNSAAVTLTAGDGSVTLEQGEGCVFIGCDLNTITVSGTENDTLKVRGNTSRLG